MHRDLFKFLWPQRKINTTKVSVGVSGVTYRRVCESGPQSVRNKRLQAIFPSLGTCVSWALCEALSQLLERPMSMAALHKGALRKSHGDEATDSWGGPSGSERGGLTYECRPWTPPSTWADMVLFSNFSSPEYIIELRITQKAAITDTWFVKLLNQRSSEQGPTTP